MSDYTKKQILTLHVYGHSASEIACMTGADAAEIHFACPDTEAVDEQRQYLREMGADV